MTHRIALLLLAAPTLACVSASAHGDDDDDDASASSSSSADDAVADEVAFYEDIAPILAEHCTGCHREGGVAPFVLTSYADAVQWAAPLSMAIEQRTMPPFTVNNDGSCQSFVDARWLSDDEIDTVARWVDGGTMEGDASLGMPSPPEQPALTGAGVRSIATPPDYVP
ncbi:MAG TPA: hypothetical protein VFG69_16340, partial [Nannocystaceae bacterium]|nr:hypothetical protein [Nannocystaceae bacterium]